MITYEMVKKAYKQGENARVVLDNLSVHINRGEYVWITGKSGSGKSTFLNVLTGIDKVDSGVIRVNDFVITDKSEDEMSQWRGRNMGIVFQFFQLLPTLTVLENILLPMDVVGKISKRERVSRAKELLELVGLAGQENKYPSMLSGGEQQRVAIARAIANDANLIIADEPTGNLDSQNAEKIYALLKKLNQMGKTIMMVTHEREVKQGVTRTIVLQDGKIVRNEVIGNAKND